RKGDSSKPLTVGQHLSRQPLLPAYATMTRKLLPVHRKRQQDVARHASVVPIPGVDVNHSAGHCRAAAIQRPATRLSTVHRVVFAGGVEIPNDFARVASISAQVS